MIKIEDREPFKLYCWGWAAHTSSHWGLRSSDFYHYDFKWIGLYATLNMSGNEFLEIVGSNEEEAIAFILKRHPYYSTYDDAKKKYISPEVQEFYSLLQTNEIESVEVKITDQSYIFNILRK